MTSFVKNVLQYVQKRPSVSEKAAQRRKSGNTSTEIQPTSQRRLSLTFRWHARVAVAHITDVVVFFGSLTGTAERYATRLAASIAERGINTVVRSLETFDPVEFTSPKQLVNTRAVVFVVSTHFADAPPNAEKFHQWLRAASDRVGPATSRESMLAEVEASSSRISSSASGPRPAKSSHPMMVLDGMQYAVFGVGDSKYLTYNAAGKFIDVRLHSIGASRLLTLGLADASNDPEGAFVKWEQSLFKILPLINSDTEGSSSNSNKRAPEANPEIESPIEPIKADILDTTVIVPLSSPRPNSSSTRRVFGADRKRATSSCPNVILLSQGDEHAVATLKNRVFDLSNVPVRLRYRCRFINEPDASIQVAMGDVPSNCSNATMTLRTKALLRKPGVMVQSIQRHNGASTAKNEIALVKLKVVDPEMTFDAADSFAYFPPNSEELVNHIASSMGFNLDAWFELYYENDQQGATKLQQLPFPTPCTIRTALTEFIEVLTLSREFVRTASRFVPVDREQEALETLASADGSAKFHAQFVEQHNCIKDLIALAPSMQLPFEVFVNFTTPIKPRLYSVSSSPQVSPGVIDIAVSLGPPGSNCTGKSVSFFKTLMNSEHGACGALLRGFVITSPFKMPVDPAAPMIMIANGTGVGPMRALLQQRELERNRMQADRLTDVDSFTTLLFLGCSTSTSLLYGEDFQVWEQNGLIHRYMAYSAEPGHECQYIQQLVTTHLEEIVELASQSPHSRIYVCGSELMAKDIRVLMQGYVEGNDPTWFSSIVSSGRYVEDAFA